MVRTAPMIEGVVGLSSQSKDKVLTQAATPGTVDDQYAATRMMLQPSFNSPTAFREKVAAMEAINLPTGLAPTTAPTTAPLTTAAPAVGTPITTITGGVATTPPATGGETRTTTPTQPPAPPQEPVTPGTPSAASDALGGFTEAEIEAALAALEAEFGMTREQLLADQSMLGAQYRLLAARLARQRTAAVEGATNDAVARGIYRSGVLGENIQGIETQFGEQQQAQEAERLAREQEIQQRLAFLEAEKQALMAQTEAGILRSTADIRRQAAGV